MVFKAKKDIEVCIIPIVIAVISFGINVYKGLKDNGSILVAVLLVVVVWGIVLSNILTIEYVFTETELIIKSWMCRKRIKLDKIVKVTPVRGTYSFSASSREQLRLTYYNGTLIHVSPLKLSEFEAYLNNSIEIAVKNRTDVVYHESMLKGKNNGVE